MTHFSPQQSFVFLDGTIDSKCYASEPPKIADYNSYANVKCDGLCPVIQAASSENEMVKDMSKHQNRKIESWQLFLPSAPTWLQI